MTSSRPYLIRAIHEWLVDNGLTPQIAVRADVPGVDVPRAYVSDGQVVLNISTTAVQGLALGNEWIEFRARFSGNPYHVRIPVQAVLAVAARENGAGMSFPEEKPDGEPPPEPEPESKSKPSLRVVK